MLRGGINRGRALNIGHTRRTGEAAGATTKRAAGLVGPPCAQVPDAAKAPTRTVGRCATTAAPAHELVHHRCFTIACDSWRGADRGGRRPGPSRRRAVALNQPRGGGSRARSSHSTTAGAPAEIAQAVFHAARCGAAATVATPGSRRRRSAVCRLPALPMPSIPRASCHVRCPAGRSSCGFVGCLRHIRSTRKQGSFDRRQLLPVSPKPPDARPERPWPGRSWGRRGAPAPRTRASGWHARHGPVRARHVSSTQRGICRNVALRRTVCVPTL